MTCKVLFLCTGNSARSIIAECLLNHYGQGRLVGHSAGSDPRGEVHPLALELLLRRGHSTEGLRSKSWDEFESENAPVMDFVFTVCDNAANEPCPVWPGRPVTAHWVLRIPPPWKEPRRKGAKRSPEPTGYWKSGSRCLPLFLSSRLEVWSLRGNSKK